MARARITVTMAATPPIVKPMPGPELIQSESKPFETSTYNRIPARTVTIAEISMIAGSFFLVPRCPMNFCPSGPSSRTDGWMKRKNTNAAPTQKMPAATWINRRMIKYQSIDYLPTS
jgi:hypothetical protein